MTSSFPSPAQLVVENITLLAGSPTSFHARYGFTITPSTFAKPTHFNTAAAVLHFLLCIIEQDAVQHLFKPCFPILDRQQERDFKKLVDVRLAVLERNKLLPHGCARKSVVSAAGGDRFIDLLWSLSSLAVQQACLSHPPYASSALHQPCDAASNASSSRSQRSLHAFSTAGSSSFTNKPSSSSSSSRRFLGMGMVTAAQQRAQSAQQMRARIDAQRAAMARTAQMGKHAALHWNSEAGSLRDKISDFEAKLRCLKMQLTAMGFDENGNDIRGGDAPQLHSSAPCHTVALNAAAIRTSSSADTLADELKTSPIDSTESGSSVGDAVDSVDGEPLSSDLKRLLTFADDTRATREQLCEDLDDVPNVNVSDASAQQIAGLVRAATEELQLATDRMDEIRDAQRPEQRGHGTQQCSQVQQRLDLSSATEPVVETHRECSPPMPVAHRAEVDITSSSSTVTDEEKALNGKEKEQLCKQSADAESQLDGLDPTNPLRACVDDALKRHKAVLESSKKLTQEANEFVTKSEAALKLMEPIDSDESVKGDDQLCVTNNLKPSWFVEALTVAATIANQLEKNAALQSNTERDSQENVSSEKDVQQAARLLEKSVASRSKSSIETLRGRRRKDSSRSLDCINLMTQSTTRSVDLASDSSSAVLCTPTSVASSTKTARSVRFAELPPSYSATRSGDDAGVVSFGKAARMNCNMEIHPSSTPASASASSTSAVTASSSQPSCQLPADDNKKAESDCDRYASRVGVVPLTSESFVGVAKREISERPTRARTFTDKSELQARKDAASGRSRRRDPHATKNDKSRPTAHVTSNRPPRLQRTQTPRRVMRRKDAIERSAVPQPPAAKSRSPRRTPPRSASVDDLNKYSKSKNKVVLVESDVTSGGRETSSATNGVASIPKDVADAQIQDTSSASLKKANSSKSSDEICDDGRVGVESLQSCVDEFVEDQPTPKAKENVQKKLFMTPDSAGSSSTALETPGDKLDAVERMYGLRKATGAVKSTLIPDSSTAKNAKFDFLQNMTPLQGSGSMNQSGSLSDEDVLFSPATRIPLPQIPNRPKATSSDGFFAGEAAQWQQSVRSQNGTENSMFREGTLTRTSSESTSRRSRFTGMLSSSSNGSGGKKSRVQLLRARLAALNK
eukprot:TRINITY_DN984_c0_g1_i1.p1 TRINITY_DN984_c0_g1~~TRINITY_DN984_c0_g1_i1.p1  ORF type:complete len:1200 (+),score=249.69 TRINITY_DN984_c0_g1_i1:176-3601(+)